MSHLRISIALAIASLSLPSAAADLVVPNQYATIQGAIDAATPGDMVLVKPGSYVESLNFSGKAITLSPESPVDEVFLRGVAGTPAITFNTVEGPSSIVEGIRFKGNGFVTGPAVMIQSASPTFIGCSFVENESFGVNERGGAVRIEGIGSSSNPSFSRCQFIDNYCNGPGGAVYAFVASPTFDDCLFGLNTCDDNGGAVHIDAGTATFNRCTLSRNAAGLLGGALSSAITGKLTCNNSEISGNQARTQGGGIYVSETDLELSGCTIVSNELTDINGTEGGGFYTTGSDRIDVVNTILWDNISTLDWQGFVSGGGVSSVFNISYCNIKLGLAGITTVASTINPGPGIINQDPMFVFAAAGDFRLDSGSPCIDAGDPANTPADCELDINREPRVVDRIDIGADERGLFFVSANVIDGASGGTVEFEYDGGAAVANQDYIIAGSITGTKPGLVIDGVLVPLNFDGYSQLTLSGATPITSGFGTLTASGTFPTTPTLTLGPVVPAFVGIEIQHSVIGFSGPIVVSASNAVTLVVDEL